MNYFIILLLVMFLFMLICWALINVILSPYTITDIHRKYGVQLSAEPLFSMAVEVRCMISRINSIRWSRNRCVHRFFRLYFRLAIFVGYLMFPYAFFTIFVSLLEIPVVPGGNADDGNRTSGEESNAMIVMIPGVNLPMSHFFILFLAICLASFIHELGHALAASRHNVPIESFGFKLIAFVPLTFVTMSASQYLKHDIIAQMEVITAGLMNNAMLCGFAYMFSNFNPLAPFYTAVPNGLMVLHLDPKSQISGLDPFDIIGRIDDRSLKTNDDWILAMNAAAARQHGFCVAKEFVDGYPASNLCHLEDCCVDEERNLCFVFRHSEIDPQPLSDKYCQISEQIQKSNLHHLQDEWKHLLKVCLPARPVVNRADKTCNPSTTYELFPYADDSRTRLIVIEPDHGDRILFWGPAAELYQSLKLSQIQARFWFMPIWLYDQTEMFFRYLFIVSFSMIIFNLIPYEPLDGYHMFALGAIFIFGDNPRLLKRIATIIHYVAAVVIISCLFVATAKLR